MKRKKLNVLEQPCTTCPYRLDTPPGIWDASEYVKLAAYDNNETFAVFLCHQSAQIGKDTVCRGWLSVHCESIAARLAVMNQEITSEELYADPVVQLYRTGNEAMQAGLKGVKRPGKKAIRKIETLKLKGVGRCQKGSKS